MPGFSQVMLDYRGAVHHESQVDPRQVAESWSDLVAVFRQLVARSPQGFEIPISAHARMPKPLLVKWFAFPCHSIAEFAFGDECVARSLMLPGLDATIETAALDAFSKLVDTYCVANHVSSQFASHTLTTRPISVSHTYRWGGGFEDIWSGTAQICLAMAYFESAGVLES